MKRLMILLLLAVSVSASAAHADGLAVSGKVGTLGMGLELTKSVSDSFTGRLGFNTFSYNTNITKSSINYNANLQLQTVSALADWYPMQGAFRATTGLYYNNNQFSLAGKPTGGIYTIGGQTYTAADIGSVNSSVSFNKIAPYLGLGWGNPAGQGKGWGLVSDFGVLFQGQANTTLDATCANPAVCAQLQGSVITERAKLQNSLSNFKLYPVASVGVSYQW